MMWQHESLGAGRSGAVQIGIDIARSRRRRIDEQAPFCALGDGRQNELQRAAGGVDKIEHVTSNAIGIFADFLEDDQVRLVGVEPAGEGIATGRHGAPLSEGREGIFFGMKSMLMQDQWGQIQESHSVSAGLQRPLLTARRLRLGVRFRFQSARASPVLVPWVTSAV